MDGIIMPALKISYDELLNWIIGFKTVHDGVGPTLQEICDKFNWVSKNTAAHALDRLEEQGRITLGDGARMIFVTGGTWTYVGKD
jgi:SOS-response transcriptional repressor LexA